MYIYEFEMLNEVEKADHIWDKGIFLASRIDGEDRYNLYDLKHFYVEVVYANEMNRIIKLKTFKSLEPLTPYLESLTIDF